MERRKPVMTILLLVIVLCLAIYILVLWSKAGESEERQQQLQKELANVITLSQTDVEKINSDFLHAFFNYTTTKERYTQIKSFMTDNGYRSTYPSGDTLPDDSRSVQSSMAGLKAYSYFKSRIEVEMINEFVLKTSYKDMTNEQVVLVRTIAKYTDELGWKIDEVEFIGEFTGRISK